MEPPKIDPPSNSTVTLPDEPEPPKQPELPPNVDVPNKIKDGKTIQLHANEEGRKQAIDVLDKIDVIGKTCSRLAVGAALGVSALQLYLSL